jgi:dihydropyrimidinase
MKKMVTVLWILLAFTLVAGPAAQQQAELIIRNGLIVTATGRVDSDLRIRNGVIAEIGRNLAAAAGAREIDAKGKLVLPGGVDPHVHLINGPGIGEHDGADDYTSGSASALAGGTTTLGNMITPNPNEELVAAFERAAAVARKQTIVDVILHIIINDVKKATPQALAQLADKGSPDIKIFMNGQGQFDQNAPAFLNVVRAAGAAGLLTMIHCDDTAITSTTKERMLAEGRGAIRYYPESSPILAEEVATNRAVAMSEATGSPIYIVHLSGERPLRVAEAAQARGLPIYVESRILYINLTKERFEEPNPGIYTGYPPLREKHDKEALWDGLAKGSVHVLATDSLAGSRAYKTDPAMSIVNSRNGAGYSQDNLPLLYSEGVRTGRITLEKFVAVTSTNAAKLFGLYPRKGTIAVGSDADIAIWDPNLKRTIRDEDELSNAKFSVFAGWEVTGWPVITIRRGEVVYQNGKVSGSPGSGQLLQRQRWQKPTLP